MAAHKNNKPYTKPNPASPFSDNKLWDFIRIGYLCFYCWLMVESIYVSWTQDIATQVVPWSAFLIQVIFSIVAIIFASQLQIQKRNLNTSIRRHLGLRWQGIDLKKIGLFSLIYVAIFCISYVKMVEVDQLNKKSTEIGVAAVSGATKPVLAKPWWAIWVIGLVICVLGPIAEEMLFRGVIMRELCSRGFSKRGAWLATAILFMIAHGKLGWGTNAAILFMGMLFGWLRMQTGTLFVPIWAHILHNTVVFIGTLYLISHGVELTDMQFVKTIKYYYTLS